MESPVRICLGAALVANLLLLSGTVSGNALPADSTPSVRDERITRLVRTNATWPRRHKTPDVALNELHPKESVSEEHTEKNAKYKDRGRVRFSPKSSTISPVRRARTSSSTESGQAAKLIIVTPTPEVKKPAQIIDSMKKYKRTKLPVSSSSTTSMPSSIKTVESSEEEEYIDEEHEEDNNNFEKYTSSKFDSNFFTIPSYNEDLSHDSEGSDNKVKSEYSSSPFGTFSSYFPEVSYDPKDNKNDEPYKSESFFNFDTELTTPKNDYFDKKHLEISQSIIKTLDSIKAKNPPPNNTNVYKITKENRGLDKLNNSSAPTNKSTILFKNTKEIRLMDNDKAGTNNKELSDVQGTSIYYEMSVLSTETYNIDHSSDDDCDNDTLPNEPTPSTADKEKQASLKATQPPISSSTKPYDSQSESISTLSSNYLPYSSVDPSFFHSISPYSFSTQNSLISTTEKTTHVYSSSFSRNRNYSKRLNLTGNKESPNSVTSRTETMNYNWRVPTRKFHYTTPKIKPIWMAPRRNATRTSYTRSTSRPPTTIYFEHFDISDKLTSTQKPKQSQNSSLTTVSSEIDPVLQGDVGGVKKVVHSQAISDNSIPSLWKRGSTKFSTSTAASAEEVDGVSDLEIPPTLTAWALASLRSPPSLGQSANISLSTQKSVDENELQKVGEVTDKKETTTTSTTPMPSAINNDIISEKITDIDQNRLPWRPVFSSVAPSTESKTEATATESKSERLPAESNISIQSSANPASTTEKEIEVTTTYPSNNEEWVSATVEDQTATEVLETIPPVDATKSTGFESITKLPSGLTTPQDETIASAEQKTDSATEPLPTTTDYEITTIRFSYVPTEPIASVDSFDTEATTISTKSWHPVFPTRTKSTVKDESITTYRPRYVTTTDMIDETTTLIIDTTPVLEISSQTIENVTEKIPETTVFEEEITEAVTVRTTHSNVEEIPTTTDLPEDTTAMIGEIITEVTTEKENTSTSTEPSSTEFLSTETETPPSEIRESSSEENSDSNEVITQDPPRVSSPPTTTTTTTKMTTTTTTEAEVETESTEIFKQSTTQEAKIIETTAKEDSTEETTTQTTTKLVNDLEDLTSFNGEMTTESSSRVLDEAGSGAAIAIAVSTIGVIALILLVGLLLVVRRRGRRGVYAQRCTPVSLDAYSLDSVSVGHRKGNHRLRTSKRSYGNPAYDDEVTSHPMQFAALANFALDMESMSAEFSEIPTVSVRPDEVPPGCEDKNRYSNVLPLPETRVPLKRIGNDPTTEYINANFITGPGNIRNYYIACQAPLPNTVSDFWRMVWEQNSRVIVMLTEYMENGVEKCYEYLPPSEVSDNKRTFGDYQIVLMKREQRDKYAVSSVQLINMATRTWREITHLWYFWPAKGVPDDYESVIDFLSEMRSCMKISQTAKEYDEEGVEVIYGDQNRSSFHNLSKLRSDDSSSGNGVNVYSPSKAEEQMRSRNVTNGTLGRMKAASEVEGVRPCVVVCASGAGRSAAIIAADICARALAAAAADVPRVVREIRSQRPHSLSNRHHYIFLYKLLSEYGNKLMGGGVDTI